MSEVFGSGYAAAYDALYRTKDYAAECDLIEGAFREFGDGRIARIADLGCGTGGHAIPLAERGYRVVGVDRSAGMLAEARSKAAAAGVGGRTEWVESDLASVLIRPPADAVLMMFAVLSYLETTEQVRGALANAARALRPGGLLVFDAWYGPAVEAQGFEPRRRVVEEGSETLVRLAEGSLDRAARIGTVSFRLQRLRGDALVSETVERHRMRYFFRDELEAQLQGTGFTPVRLSAFPELAHPLDASTWSLLMVARR